MQVFYLAKSGLLCLDARSGSDLFHIKSSKQGEDEVNEDFDDCEADGDQQNPAKRMKLNEVRYVKHKGGA